MFTGIIEEVGTVLSVIERGTNRDLVIGAVMATGLKVDQSVAHNGVCLTVVDVSQDRYTVTAVKETLDRSNLGMLAVGNGVDLERSLRLGDRLDGHMVQGHVDTTTLCTAVMDLGGSWSFVFALPDQPQLMVNKGSVCINGTSLTIAQLDERSFGVAIIPYTFEHTTFRTLRAGVRVNIEYDVLGKYVERMLASRFIV
jgi:riboflavin synthase